MVFTQAPAGIRGHLQIRSLLAPQCLAEFPGVFVLMVSRVTGERKEGGGQKFLTPSGVLISFSWCPPSSQLPIRFRFYPLVSPNLLSSPSSYFLFLSLFFLFFPTFFPFLLPPLSPFLLPSLLLLFSFPCLSSVPIHLLGFSPGLPNLSPCWSPGLPVPHLSSFHQLLTQGAVAQAVTSGETKGNFFTMFLAGSLAVVIAIYVGGNVSGEDHQSRWDVHASMSVW